MKLLRFENNKVYYPYSLEMLKADNPQTCFPAIIRKELFNRWNVFEVTRESRPSYNKETQVLKEQPPKLVNGSWIISWEVLPKSQKELDSVIKKKKALALEQRQKLLNDSDWIVIKSLEEGVEIPPSIKTFRKALRDLTNNKNWPLLTKEDWPTLPEELK